MLTTSRKPLVRKRAKLEAWNDAPRPTLIRSLLSGIHKIHAKNKLQCKLEHNKLITQSLDEELKACPLPKTQVSVHDEDSTTRVNCMPDKFNTCGSPTRQEATVKLQGKPVAAGDPV